MNDLNLNILSLKNKIIKDISESQLPISVVTLLLSSIEKDMKETENHFLDALIKSMEAEKENKEENK